MQEYHKIQTVFLRDPATKYKTLLQGVWSKPEFELLKDIEWAWTEKVDGTNIRVMWNGGDVTFGGKTDKAQIPADLVNRLNELFHREDFESTFDPDTPVCLYGEGFGRKIQKVGPKYIPDGVDFILFDVKVGTPDTHQIWLERKNVEDIAEKMMIKVVPIVGKGPLGDAIQMAKNGFQSTLGDLKAEGLIMKPSTELLNRLGRRIITKLKTKDFAQNGSGT
jgi:ATP-dependent RNA circularization protein (DNA/RNA ligase family)